MAPISTKLYYYLKPLTEYRPDGRLQILYSARLVTGNNTKL